MPTYAYACTQCAHRFDAVQSFADPSLTECPECGGTLRKEYGKIGVTFNGSGFYRTDSRADSARAGAKKDGGSKKDGGAKKDAASSSTPGSTSASSPASSSAGASASPAPSGS